MIILSVVILLLINTYLVIRYLPNNNFFFCYWKSIQIYSFITTSIALILSFNDPIYEIENSGLAILKISLLETIFSVIALIVLIKTLSCLKEIENIKLNKNIVIILIISSIYLLISIIIFFGKFTIEINKEIFPFGLLVENLARIAPFIGAYYWSKLIRVNRNLVIFSLILFYIYCIPSGSRGMLIISLFFLLFWCIKGSILKKILITIFGILIYSHFEDTHRSFRHVITEVIEDQSRIDQLKNVSLEDIGAINLGFIENFRLRVTHKYMLMGPINEYLSKNDPVGFEPLKSSVLSIIPSFVLDGDKPWPGSTDGSKYSSFRYLVNDVATGEWWNMSEYPGVLHPIWESGYIYAVFSMIISGLFISLLIKLSNILKEYMYIIPIVSIYPFTYLRFQPQIVEIPLMFNYVTLPALFIYSIFLLSRKLINNTIIK